MTAPGPEAPAGHPGALWVASLPKQGGAPEAPQPAGDAVYFDGTSSRRHEVRLQFNEMLEIVADDNVIARWPYAEIRRADGAPGKLRLSCETALPLARLEIAGNAAKAEIMAHCLKLNAGHHGSRQTGRIVLWSLAAVCSIVLMSLYGIPYAADRLAPLVPFGVEKRIGESVDAQVRGMFDGKVCSDPEGRAAFQHLVHKLRQASGIALPLEAEVLSSSVPNAFALPGGKVYLMDGLLQRAQSPDEIAGVLAHEIGHVHHRDTLRRVIQTGGTSFLIGLLFGDISGSGAVIFVGRTMLDASYSRDTEASADQFAVEVMRQLGRSARPMAELLLRVTGAKSPGKGPTILASHPLSEDRLAAIKKEERPVTGPELISAREWQALKGICRTTEARRGRSVFR